MAYCTENDVKALLGDLELPTSVNVTSFLTKAAKDIDLALGARYTVPVTPGDYFTTTLLGTINAELAAAQLLMALAQGGEDNRVNAYAMHLYKRANERLMPYLQDLVLPGASLISTGSAGTLGPVVIYHEDSGSLLESYYRFVQDVDNPLGWR